MHESVFFLRGEEKARQNACGMEEDDRDKSRFDEIAFVVVILNFYRFGLSKYPHRPFSEFALEEDLPPRYFGFVARTVDSRRFC